jgi:peptidyl-tRNA hydrolase
MPILTNHRDSPEKILQRSSQEDPWVMYLVVRTDEPVSDAALRVAAAQATMRCTTRFENSDVWRDSFHAWSERSFRKVTLRAQGNAWTKLDTLDHAASSVGGREVIRVFPPRLRSQCGPLLKSLQVFSTGLDAPAVDDTSPRPGEGVTTPHEVAMAMVINPATSMSLGKQLAQIAHAVLMCARSTWVTDPRYSDAFIRWIASDFPCEILPSSTWSHLREHADGVVVCDAGLTEVDPGTETVLAFPPGQHD